MFASVNDIPAGAIVLTFGQGRYFPPYWPPQKVALEFLKEELYEQERIYQRGRGCTLCDATHVRAITEQGCRFFEMTSPRGRYVPLSELIGKRLAVCISRQPFDLDVFRAECAALDGEKYDIIELWDFMVSGWLKLPIRWALFDKVNRTVCSTAIARCLARAGFVFPAHLRPKDVYPAWYENRPGYFDVTYMEPAIA